MEFLITDYNSCLKWTTLGEQCLTLISEHLLFGDHVLTKFEHPIDFSALVFSSSALNSTCTCLMNCRLCLLFGVQVDGTCTRGQECTKPWFERLRKRSESLRYWAYVSCLLFCWLSFAFFLHWQVQRWELSTMVPADPQGVTDGAFDPGGSFCHSMWPNTGLGCQISFTAM